MATSTTCSRTFRKPESKLQTKFNYKIQLFYLKPKGLLNQSGPSSFAFDNDKEATRQLIRLRFRIQPQKPRRIVIQNVALLLRSQIIGILNNAD